jgi:hypothetical protein
VVLLVNGFAVIWTRERLMWPLALSPNRGQLSVQSGTVNGMRLVYSPEQAMAASARIEKDRLMMTWMKRPRAAGNASSPAETRAAAKPRPFAVPAEYLSLHKYLDGRFANTVVLTFAEIEDLLGFALPELARFQQEWWADADAGSIPSAQSRSWTQASRTARPNLLARTVVFERAPA